MPGGTYLEQVGRQADESPVAFQISDLVMQARYRWQIAPMSDLYVVYKPQGRAARIRAARRLPGSPGLELRESGTGGRPRQAPLPVRPLIATHAVYDSPLCVAKLLANG